MKVGPSKRIHWALSAISLIAILNSASRHDVFLRIAAELGSADAQARLGAHYSYQNDYVSAAKWYRRAADQGDRSTGDVLAGMYEHGRGVNQDFSEAFKLYLQSAEQGDASDQARVGEMYLNGQGVKKYEVAAVSWTLKAANQGDTTAQLNLGMMYGEGHAVKQDYAEALFWTLLSQRNNQGTELIEIQKHLTSEQIAMVRHRAEEWQPPTPADATKEEKISKSKFQSLPESAAKALATADDVNLISLLPWGSGSQTGSDSFHGWPILGRIKLSGTEARQVAQEFQKAIDRPLYRMQAGCFNPRHGLSIVLDGHKFDFVLCYECGAEEVYVDDKKIANLVAAGWPRFLNDILVRADIPLRKLQ